MYSYFRYFSFYIIAREKNITRQYLFVLARLGATCWISSKYFCRNPGRWI